MITAEQIKSVNERIKKIEVKGKAYACVPARVQAFREICPEGSIETDIMAMEDGVVTMKAVVRDGEGRVIASGLAQEKESSSYINKTSYIENCETSAVGRALGFLGLGSDEQMASAEELVNAINNQGSRSGGKDRKETGPAPMICEECMEEVKDYVSPTGVFTKAYDVANGAYKNYGKILCAKCAQKEARSRKEAEAYANREDGVDE